MIGAFAEFYSGSLGNHIRKGLEQRATEGKHTGGIPFGYESCWMDGDKGERKRLCDPEHPGGIHIQSKEGQIVTGLFKRYASGATTLSQLAAWLNEEGFRTRNTHKLSDADGNLTAGPRLFTTASVRGILHNPFYTGKVSYKDKLIPGLHEPLIDQEIFDIVQTTLRKNSVRSETLHHKPEREYLLQGIIRCAYCGMPMWAQTYQSGRTYYREHKASRSLQECSACGGSIPCHVADEQMRKLVSAIELDKQWLEEVLSIISLKDEVERVKKERQSVLEKLRRMGKAYIDGLFPDEEYHRQKKIMEMELESLVVPAANATEEAGNLIMNLRNLWAEANMEEPRKLLLTMLDAVYFDTKQTRSIVAVKPKRRFRPIFQVAATRDGSGIYITKEPLDHSNPEAPCFWWRRGRVELPVQRRQTQDVLQA